MLIKYTNYYQISLQKKQLKSQYCIHVLRFQNHKNGCGGRLDFFTEIFFVIVNFILFQYEQT